MASSFPLTRDQELRDSNSTLTRVAERLASLPPLPHDIHSGMMKLQIETLTREVGQLKSANVQLTSTVKWLQHQNEELERRLALCKPEVENAVASRAKLQKKLGNAYKVIKDLLGEIDVESSSSSSDSRNREKISDTSENVSVSSKSTPLMEGSATPQPPHHQLSEQGENMEPLPPHHPGTIPDRHGEEQGHSSEPIDDAISVAGSKSSSASSSSQSEYNPNVPSIQYNKPPGSSGGICAGPFELSDVASTLGFQNEGIQAVRRLHSRIDFGIRLSVVPLDGQMATAFLFDPLFLEEGGSTYLIDWAFSRDNRKTKQTILHMRGYNPSFHTFTFPAKRGKWYYVGTLSWRVADKPLYWPTLNEKCRERIARKLSTRSGETYSIKEIETMLDKHELEEICVQLDAMDDVNISETFRHRLLHHNQQVQTRGESSTSNSSD